jgi:hypothetical protein
MPRERIAGSRVPASAADGSGIALARPRGMWRLCALATAVLACGGHTLMRNTVVMTISPTEANVCLRPGSFAVGDRVNIYQTTCQMGVTRAMDCRRHQIGAGRITRALNDHYATMELASASRLEEGFVVEVVR